MEGRRFFLMKRAERFEIRAGTLQGKIRADYFNDIVGGGDLLDVLRRNGAHADFTFRSFEGERDAKITQRSNASNQ